MVTQVSPKIEEAELNYYIHYTEEEKQFGGTLSLITICFLGAACISSLFYNYKIGSGRLFKIIESAQLFSMLRLLDLRFSYHMEQALDILSYSSLSFLYDAKIPQFFRLLADDWEHQAALAQCPPNFQIHGYSPVFLLNAGGLLISVAVYLGVAQLVLLLLIKVISYEPVLNVLEEVNEYFQFQLWVRLY